MSTLKRKFYAIKNELGLQQWPQNFTELRHHPIFPKMYPLSINFVMNTSERDEKDLGNVIQELFPTS